MSLERNTISKISAEAKQKRAIAAFAIRIAKEKNDQLYKKSTKFKKLWQSTAAAIERKYRPEAKVRYLESKKRAKK